MLSSCYLLWQESSGTNAQSCDVHNAADTRRFIRMAYATALERETPCCVFCIRSFEAATYLLLRFHAENRRVLLFVERLDPLVEKLD